MTIHSMEPLIELIKVLGPAALVLYLAYLLVRSFLNKQLDEIRLQVAQKSQEVVIPVRLQAYERICLLLERISPTNLLSRINNPELNAIEYQHILINEIREEFNHNLSQQVYMSAEAWNQVQNAVEDVISLINEAGGSLEGEEKGLALAKKVIDLSMARPADSTRQALDFVKTEIQGIF